MTGKKKTWSRLEDDGNAEGFLYILFLLTFLFCKDLLLWTYKYHIFTPCVLLVIYIALFV